MAFCNSDNLQPCVTVRGILLCGPICADSLWKATVQSQAFVCLGETVGHVRAEVLFPLLEWPLFLLKTRGKILCKRQWSSPLPSCRSPKSPQAIAEAAQNQNIDTNKFRKHRQRKIEHSDLCTWRHTYLKRHCHGQILPVGYYTEVTDWLKPMAFATRKA